MKAVVGSSSQDNEQAAGFKGGEICSGWRLCPGKQAPRHSRFVQLMVLALPQAGSSAWP